MEAEFGLEETVICSYAERGYMLTANTANRARIMIGKPSRIHSDIVNVSSVHNVRGSRYLVAGMYTDANFCGTIDIRKPTQPIELTPKFICPVVKIVEFKNLRFYFLQDDTIAVFRDDIQLRVRLIGGKHKFDSSKPCSFSIIHEGKYIYYVMKYQQSQQNQITYGRFDIEDFIIEYGKYEISKSKSMLSYKCYGNIIHCEMKNFYGAVFYQDYLYTCSESRVKRTNYKFKDWPLAEQAYIQGVNQFILSSLTITSSGKVVGSGPTKGSSDYYGIRFVLIDSMQYISDTTVTTPLIRLQGDIYPINNSVTYSGNFSIGRHHMVYACLNAGVLAVAAVINDRLVSCGSKMIVSKASIDHPSIANVHQFKSGGLIIFLKSGDKKKVDIML